MEWKSRVRVRGTWEEQGRRKRSKDGARKEGKGRSRGGVRKASTE